MADSIGVGIVGTGFAANFHAESWAAVRGARLLAVAGRGIDGRGVAATPDAAPHAADPEAGRASKDSRTVFMNRHGIARGYDFAGLLRDSGVDVVDICTPNFLHATMAIAAMEAGKDVICEKPLATTVADGKRVVDAQKATGRWFFYAEDWIFAPALVRAATLIAEGAIGKVLYVKAKESHSGSHSPNAQKIATCGGGSLMHLGIHPAGFLHHLLGSPERVTGNLSGGSEKNFLHKDLEGEDWGIAILEYADGARAVIEGNYITQGGMDDRVEIYGSSGLIKVDLTFGSPLSAYSRDGFAYAVEKAEMTKGWTRPAVDEQRNLGYPDEFFHFVACMRGEKSQLRGTTAEDGFSALRVIDAAYRSNREGRAILF